MIEQFEKGKEWNQDRTGREQDRTEYMPWWLCSVSSSRQKSVRSVVPRVCVLSGHECHEYERRKGRASKSRSHCNQQRGAILQSLVYIIVNY